MQYEFRTLKDRRNASLVMLAGCDNDIEAILIAQEFLRKGEGLEVWRGDDLVYRLAARIRTGKRARRSELPAVNNKFPSAPAIANRAPALRWLDAARRLIGRPWS
jgi:two-component sensor histidine kinase